MAVDIIARGMAAVAGADVSKKADLVNGKVPASQLPSYVDDVVEYPTRSSFPAEGEAGKIYVALDTNTTYRWSGSEYVIVGGASIPECPATTDGVYMLIATVSQGVRTYTWIEDTTLKTTESAGPSYAIVGTAIVGTNIVGGS
ncbi:MAG: hypothetical protein J6S67_07645 [Methanobrevibacter sp.]|nr:hypothetical protein [Methanobrevibacter sp.]